MITSTFSIDSAGNCRSASGPERPTSPEGFPLMSIRTLSFPRREMLPSTSTETEGILSITSETLPPRTVISLPTLYTRLSRRISTSVRSATSSTSSSASTEMPRAMVPKSVVSRRITPSLTLDSNEIYSVVMVYRPGKTSNLKLPSASVIPPCKRSGKRGFLSVMVAYSRGCFVSSSITFPERRIFGRA